MTRSDNTPPPIERGQKVAYHLRNDSPPSRGLQSPREATGKSSDDIHVRSYSAPNWFSSVGVLKKRRQIEGRGLPSFKNWRFITLTLNRDLFDSPLEGYLAGKDKIRRFLNAARKENLWSTSARWCWKMEFQRDGWAHWHLLVDRTAKFTEAQLTRIGELWALGRTNVERVQENDFLYTFKYAFKPVFVEGEGDFEDGDSFVLPHWFLDYVSSKTVKVEQPDGSIQEAEKPVTFAKVRFWQTSKGFYTGKPIAVSERKEQSTWTIPLPVRDLAERASKSVQIISRKRSGRYLKSAIITLSICASQIWNLAAWYAVDGKAVFMAVNSAVLPKHIIERNTQQTWKLKELLEQNQLTVRRAARLQTQGQTLRTC